VKEYVKTAVVKDFIWEKKDGKWQVKNVPIGEGMVDFVAFFKEMKAFGFAGPISMHFEYPMPHEDKALSKTETRNKTITAMKKDLNRTREFMQEAGYEI
jgi:L-ribulose-5-phosphate 3-epimerase UlaE